MSPNNKKYTLKEFTSKDESLKSTDLYDIYLNFQNICTSNGQNHEFCSLNEDYESVHESVKEIYKKLATNLKRISDKNEYHHFITNDKSNLCIYLKYWFYDQVTTEGYQNSHISKVIQEWEKKKTEKCPECNCELFSMKKNQFQQIKWLYDYFLFYHKCKDDKSKIFIQIYDKPYCKHIKNSYYNYITLRDMCDENNTSATCREFNEYIKNHIEIEQISLPCKDEAHVQETFEHSSADARALANGRAEEITGSYQVHGVGIDGLVSETSIQSNGTDRTIPIVVSVSLMSAFIMFFLFYKFTPIRKILHPGVHRIQKFWKNIVKENDHIQTSSPEYQETFPGYDEYNMSYHSLKN
ncbi:PIR Superfamily Protein [Plasmodium ovale curtisi]|uniref:PIR Superfamily Protein n=1 Tax=Plasmodium ovale curtisi TaxID=864141 RepID=A0A1A8WH49_PLAOA|nr:PIR Superfamily Protein [Plasmodium ovale curtisi]